MILRFACLVFVISTSTFVCELNAQNFVRNVSNNGTVAAAFLEIGIGARAEAMGGAYVAQRGSAEMIYWNAAGIAFSDQVQTSFTNAAWLADMSLDFGSIVVPLKKIKGAVGIGFTTLGAPEQAVRTVAQPEGTGEMYDTRDFAFNLSFSSKLADNFSVGVTTKYISQRIYAVSATQIAFDAGILYLTPLKGLTMGASLSNFGGEMSLGGRLLDDIIDPDVANEGVENIPVSYKTRAEALPQNFRFGLAYETQFANDFALITAVDLLHPRAATESINLGAELGFKKLLFIRGGFQNLFERYAINGLTLGAGLQYMLPNRSTFTMDYAWSDWGILNQTHRISVGISF